jgi:hypothetical protein
MTLPRMYRYGLCDKKCCEIGLCLPDSTNTTADAVTAMLIALSKENYYHDDGSTVWGLGVAPFLLAEGSASATCCLLR